MVGWKVFWCMILNYYPLRGDSSIFFTLFVMHNGSQPGIDFFRLHQEAHDMVHGRNSFVHGYAHKVLMKCVEIKVDLTPIRQCIFNTAIPIPYLIVHFKGLTLTLHKNNYQLLTWKSRISVRCSASATSAIESSSEVKKDCSLQLLTVTSKARKDSDREL